MFTYSRVFFVVVFLTIFFPSAFLFATEREVPYRVGEGIAVPNDLPRTIIVGDILALKLGKTYRTSGSFCWKQNDAETIAQIEQSQGKAAAGNEFLKLMNDDLKCTADQTAIFTPLRVVRDYGNGTKVVEVSVLNYAKRQIFTQIIYLLTELPVL